MPCENLLQQFIAIAPYLNQITSADIGVTIYEGDTCVLYIPAEKLVLNIKPGDKMPPGGAAEQCIQKKKRIFFEKSKEESLSNIPFIANAFPIIADDGSAIGCILTTETTDVQNIIRDTSENLKTSSSQLAMSMQELNKQAEKLASSGKVLKDIATHTVEKVKDTDKIVSFINDVAEQTNLLGLNAAIEAARVGELGRGFGVVSDEVRKLAVHSSKSAKQINEVLQAIKESNNSLATQSKDVETAVQEQVAVIQQIASAGQQLAAMADELQKLSQNMLNMD